MSLNKALTWLSPDLSVQNTIYWLPTEMGWGLGGIQLSLLPHPKSYIMYFILPLTVSL